MKTYFIRHTEKLSISDDTKNLLWTCAKIAVHFPRNKNGQWEENKSTRPEDYIAYAAAGAKALRYLNELGQSGGYVLANYHGREEFIVGKIEKGSSIELISGLGSGREVWLKGFTLTKVKKLPCAKFVGLLAGRPQQGTMSPWNICEDAVEKLVENENTSEISWALSTAKQETLCAEYLRLPEAKSASLPTLKFLLLPVGRTIKDIDIYGLSDTGKKIIAQVTYRSDYAEKLRRLKTYADSDAELILFCKRNGAEQIIEDGVIIFPIEKVFEAFSTDATRKKVIEIN